ncbi:hypothetical protein HAX54_045877, partial [Datura stramonium]|nr:hypothetical protein [Datura stramonium]
MPEQSCDLPALWDFTGHDLWSTCETPTLSSGLKPQTRIYASACILPGLSSGSWIKQPS